MTHNGGQPHAVGYKGQRYEVSIFDEAADGRRVVGWTNYAEKASQMATGAELRPGWTIAWVTDLFTDISHTQHGKWIGERPLPSNVELRGDEAGRPKASPRTKGYASAENGEEA